MKRNLIPHNIYVKDISLEVPNSPEIFLLDWEPLDFDMNVGFAHLEDNLYEVALKIVLTVNLQSEDDKESTVAFLVELVQAGIFILDGFTESEIEAACSVKAPEILFPYARETVSSLVIKAGFPQLLLPAIDFAAMYKEYREYDRAEDIKAANEPITV